MPDVRSNFLISLFSSNAILIINFIGSMFLARILTPHEIGVFSVAYVFAGLLRTIREMGIGSYIVQESDLTTLRFRTAFGMSIILAVVTGGVVAALAVPVSTFYREPGIADAMLVIALSFLLVPFGATTQSVLRRDMRFKEMAVINSLSALVQNVAAVLLAWAGLSYMSLAWSSLIGILATIICVLNYRPASLPWLPSLAEWRRVIKFGSYVSGSSLVSYFNASLSDLLLGRLINMEAVALFNRAKSLSELVSGILWRATSSVSLPYFSQAIRDGNPVTPPFLHATTLYSTLSIPICTVLAVIAEPTILLLYGDQWVSSAPLLQILCLTTALGAPATLINQLLTAMGEVKAQFKLDVQYLFFKLVLVLVCAPFGLEAVAWGYCACALMTTVQRLVKLFSLSGMRLREILATVEQSIFPTVLSVTGPLVVTNIKLDSLLMTLLLSLLTATAGFVFALIISENSLWKEWQIFRKGI
jgi:O-antigen/teichoic acid export membrane protein